MPINILLLTNRDSDNTGDQVIEICDIALIRTVIKNLGIRPMDYTITSRAASIISQKYLKTKDSAFLQNAEDQIKKADIVIFGGAPLFNYLYQEFYERTAVTLELAQKHGKPVIFSAIGIERYNEKNKKCQRLKKALNMDCVKQITTRDGLEYLEKFRENPNIRIAKVSDPAVFSSTVFKKFKYKPWNRNKFLLICKKMKTGFDLFRTKRITIWEGIDYLRSKLTARFSKENKAEESSNANNSNFGTNTNGSSRVASNGKKIGIFILRANGFTDNKVNFSRDRAAQLWVDLVHDLENKGYDYKLLTNGHFGDEAFLDCLIRDYGINENKCIFNMNTPEALIRKISAYDGIITCRLHPSIIAFSFKVPSVSLVWNSKVKGFYQSIGYEDRMIETTDISSKLIIERLEKAMAEGVSHNEEYLMSVYQTLFDAIKKILKPEDDSIKAYTYEELIKKLVLFGGTVDSEKEKKLQRKFRRAYQKYNEQAVKIRELKEAK